MTIGGPLLAIDTSTSAAVVALGDSAGLVLAVDSWPAGQRHSEELLPRIAALLAAASLRPADLGAIVVGTGPGAFTGLRVGLATAKTLAHQLGLPLAGISSADALLEAALQPAGHRGSDGPALAPGGSAPAAVLLLPAGAADRVMVRPGQAPERLTGGREPDLAAGELVVAVDLAGRAEPEAIARGAVAQRGLGAALVRRGAARLASGSADDVARLVPEYVTLPRGVPAATGEIEWSRDHR